MEASEMTPEELRRYAAEKEASRRDLERRYLNIAPAEPAPAQEASRAPWEREVEFEGDRYVVDMRPFRSREFFRRAARINDERAADSLSTTDMLDFYEFCFGGEGGVDEQATARVTERLGYEDYQEVLRIEDGIFGLVDAKN
jgi:hypothetical protein